MRSSIEAAEGGGNLGDVLGGHLAQAAVNHRPHLASVDEEGLTLLRFITVNEPQRHGNLRGIEQLRRHGDDALHKVVLHNFLANLALAAALGGQ
ncbi:hypothetical protein SDC9_185001 [bioreactor metagenome]|uniref:Uncharacterized protein n=1 Tax=bioreactor metagenome TaxID=1076179 RepID=A0A645HGG2_9ZZZZ